MTLKERIDQYMNESAGTATPEMMAVIQRSSAELLATIPSRIIPTVGTALPEFSLSGSQGDAVSSKQMLESGPLVITFFRGMW